MTDPELARLINGLLLGAVTVLFVAWFARMFYRLGIYLFIARATPDVILIRDLALAGSFAWALGLSLLLRVLGISVVDNVAVALITGAPVLGGLALAVFVEYRLIDKNGGKP